jgi:hypothetical protein
MAATYEALGDDGRYLIEHRVHLPGGITGSCDLYDRARGTVIDSKNTSPDRAPWPVVP